MNVIFHFSSTMFESKYEMPDEKQARVNRLLIVTGRMGKMNAINQPT
jgi:hypothetical protein